MRNLYSRNILILLYIVLGLMFFASIKNCQNVQIAGSKNMALKHFAMDDILKEKDSIKQSKMGFKYAENWNDSENKNQTNTSLILISLGSAILILIIALVSLNIKEKK